MRIVAGKFKGMALAEVGAGDASAHLRPTSDRVREAVFNLLAHGDYDDPVTGARVLDLFAGTGALGFEALSRGAERVVFVDDGKVAQKILLQNINSLGVEDRATRVMSSASGLGENREAGFGLIFLDPPYRKALGEAALAACAAGGWIAPGATVVWEESALITPPPGFRLRDERRYGETRVSILTWQAAP